jgi:Redoxin.
MIKMYNELKSKGVEVVLVTQYYGFFEGEQKLTPDQEYAKLKGYLEKWELPFPLIVGGKENFKRYGVGGIPHYTVIDQQGKVHSYTIGYNEPLHAQLRKSVESLLKPAEEQK